MAKKRGNYKKRKANVKRMFYSGIVILIVLAFGVSFFSMFAFSDEANKSNAEPTSEKSAANDETSEENSRSAFMVAVKASMIEGDTSNETAQAIVNTLNIYNSLNADKKVTSFDGESADFNEIRKALIASDIYFDDISSNKETAAWELVIVDEEGVSYLK